MNDKNCSREIKSCIKNALTTGEQDNRRQSVGQMIVAELRRLGNDKRKNIGMHGRVESQE